MAYFLSDSEFFPNFFFHIYFPHKKHFDFPVEIYNCWVIFFVVSGKFRYQIASGETGCVEGGEIVLCPPDTAFFRTMITPIQMHMIKFNTSSHVLAPGKYTFPDTLRLLEDARRLNAYAPKCDLTDNVPAQHFCRDLWLSLCELPTRAQAQSNPIQTILRYLQTNFTYNPTNAELARMVGFSVAYLIHLFHVELNTTPHQYLTHLRLEKAKQLLLDSEQKISDIATLCGFQDAFYFSRLFHREIGISPSEFRQIGHL